MKEYIWQRLGNPVECALVRAGLVRVLHALLHEGGAGEDGTRQAVAHAERFGLLARRDRLTLDGPGRAWQLEATDLAQVFVDPAYAALAAAYEDWHRAPAARLRATLTRAYDLCGEPGLRPALAH